ncbi:MAG: SRPBCC domain-containing protein [Planctomycetota bacterium]
MTESTLCSNNTALPFRCEIAAPVERVYQMLTDAEALRLWLEAESKLEPKSGSAFSLEWNNSPAGREVVRGEVLKAEPNKRLWLSWRLASLPATTRLDIRVSGEDGKTVLEAVHDGFGQGGQWDSMIDEYNRLWNVSFNQLRALAECPVDHPRQTLVQADVEVDSIPPRIFRSLSLPWLLCEWWLRQAEVEPRNGGFLRMLFRDGRVAAGEVLLYDPPHMLQLRVEIEGVPSIIRISIKPAGRKSRVHVQQSGFELEKELEAVMQRDWDEALSNLKVYLEREPGSLPLGGDREFEQTVLLNVEHETVWNAITDPSHIARWFSDRTVFQGHQGGLVAYIWDTLGEVRGTIVDIQPQKLLHITWDLPEEEARTEVVYNLVPTSQGTRLEVLHQGFGEGEEWDREMRRAEIAWASELRALKFYLERHSGKLRRRVWIRRYFDAEADRLWQCFTDPDLLSQWLAKDVRFQARVDQPFKISFTESWNAQGTVLLLSEQDREMLLEWDLDGADLVHVAVIQGAERARVLFYHAGFGRDENWEAGVRELWYNAFRRFEELLAGQKPEL